MSTSEAWQQTCRVCKRGQATNVACLLAGSSNKRGVSTSEAQNVGQPGNTDEPVIWYDYRATLQTVISLQTEASLQTGGQPTGGASLQRVPAYRRKPAYRWAHLADGARLQTGKLAEVGQPTDHRTRYIAVCSKFLLNPIAAARWLRWYFARSTLVNAWACSDQCEACIMYYMCYGVHVWK